MARLLARHVDGLIIPGTAFASTVYASAPPDAWPPGLPVVVAGSPAAPARVPAAAVDHAHGARLVLDHLAGLGHRRTGRITLAAGGAGPSHRPGVIDLAAKAGTAQEGQRCAHALLARGCTAIAAATDLLAAGALAAVAQAGLRCPADITVVGYGDTPLSAALTPAADHRPAALLPGRPARRRAAAGRDQRPGRPGRDPLRRPRAGHPRVLFSAARLRPSYPHITKVA